MAGSGLFVVALNSAKYSTKAVPFQLYCSTGIAGATL